MESTGRNAGTSGTQPAGRDNGQSAQQAEGQQMQTGREAQQGQQAQRRRSGGREGRRGEVAMQQQGAGDYLPQRRVQNPFGMLMQLSDEMNRMMESFFGRDPFFARGGLFGRGEGGMGGNVPQLWAPQIEVQQRGNELLISADLPGVKKEDINIECSEDQIVISGERRDERETNERGVHRTERSYGSFYRAIPLPEGAQTENARASMRDGVLELTVPLQQSAQSRRIQIQS